MSPAFEADDAWHLAAGTHRRLYDVLGAHPDPSGTTTFRVWAPSAQRVSVVGESNGWRAGVDPLDPDPSGVWRGSVTGFPAGSTYKFAVEHAGTGRIVAKSDPVAFWTEEPPATASVVWRSDHTWTDEIWMRERGERQRHDRPMSIYELHLGSWRYEPGGYRAIAEQLADYCVDLGFTHVELMPVTEHPFYGSWGYQTTGYFAPTARYGSPDDFKAMIDLLHGAGLGVIMDWVPSHFPVDEHGLGFFDGTHLYEHADPRQGFHPDWTSFVFNYERNEVRSFLLSSAHYWLDRFHIDGLRVDAVASMLYLDYSRADGEWIPNPHGGNENLGAIAFMQELNRSAYEAFPDIVMVAEESTAWGGVTAPTDSGGLGFGLKWDMGWMHDTLEYLGQDPLFRSSVHDKLTFRTVYQSSEQYVLPLSHDEVVHGKGSLLARMPGDRPQRFANLRLLLGYQWTVPGKKLLFMGGEFGAFDEWNHEQELAWASLGRADHAGTHAWVRHLNRVYRDRPALHRVDRDPSGFEWVVGDDADQSVYAFLRHAPAAAPVLVVMNGTPVCRQDYRIGVPSADGWRVVANSDDSPFGGSGDGPSGVLEPQPVERHGKAQSLVLTLPPLSLLVLAAEPTSA